MPATGSVVCISAALAVDFDTMFDSTNPLLVYHQRLPNLKDITLGYVFRQWVDFVEIVVSPL